MGTDTYTLIGAAYRLEHRALEDHENVRDAYDPEFGGTFDAAVVSRYADGSVHVVAKTEESTRQGSVVGGGTGLALGALAAVLPAIAAGPGVAIGTAAGAGVGAIAGHVKRGLHDDDLRELGELLERGESGLIVVVDPATEGRVRDAIGHSDDIVTAQVRFDVDGLAPDGTATAQGATER